MCWTVDVDRDIEVFLSIFRFSLFATLNDILLMELPVSGVPASLNECLFCPSHMRNGGDVALYTFFFKGSHI